MDKASINTTALGTDSEFIVNDNISFGEKKKDEVADLHLIQKKLVQHDLKQQEIRMNVLKRIQGIHAPLRLQMEKRALMTVDAGHLPCLYRHNASMDALTGRDVEVNEEDFFNFSIDSEVARIPHIAIERHFNIL